MRKTLIPLTLVVGIGLISAPAMATPSVELLPPGNVIAFDESAVPDPSHPLSPIASISQPFMPGTSADGRGGDGDQSEPKCHVLKASEHEFAERINKARARRGRKPVNLDLEISAASAVHSRAMKRQERLYHTGEEQLRYRVTRWELLGENVGRGASPDSLHKAFMASPGHRRTVLDERFRHVGVAIVRDSSQVWMTVLFETHIDPGTRVRMPEGC